MAAEDAVVQPAMLSVSQELEPIGFFRVRTARGETNMRQMLYISSVVRGTIIDLSAIVGQSIRNNRRVGVTGLLWSDGKRFLQALDPASATRCTMLSDSMTGGRMK